MFLAAVRSYGHYEHRHAVGGLFPMSGPGYGLRHLVAVVLRVAAVGSPMVHGALLVFLFAHRDEADYAGVARKEMGIHSLVYRAFRMRNLLASHWFRGEQCQCQRAGMHAVLPNRCFFETAEIRVQRDVQLPG